MRHWSERGLVSRVVTAVATASIIAVSLSFTAALPAGAITTMETLQSQLISPGLPWAPDPGATVASTGMNPTTENLPSASKVYQFGDGSLLLLGLIKADSTSAAVAGETKFMQQICNGSNAVVAVKGLNEGVATSCTTTRSSGGNEDINVVVGSKDATIIYAISTGSRGPVPTSALVPIAIKQYQALPTSMFTVVNIAIAALIVIALLLIVMIVRTQINKRSKRKEEFVPQYDDGAYENDKVFVGASVVAAENEGPVPGGRAHGSAYSQAYVANPPPGLGLYPEFEASKKSEGPTPLPSFNAPRPGFGHTPDARARMVTATATIQRVPPQAAPPPPGNGNGNGSTPALAVGWHADPAHPHVQNFWDGTSWTKQTQWDGTAWVTSG